MQSTIHKEWIAPLAYMLLEGFIHSFIHPSTCYPFNQSINQSIYLVAVSIGSEEVTPIVILLKSRHRVFLCISNRFAESSTNKLIRDIVLGSHYDRKTLAFIKCFPIDRLGRQRRDFHRRHQPFVKKQQCCL